MPRGKKFDAAEKHFLEKKEKLDKDIKYLRERLVEEISRREQIEAQLAVALRRISELESENILLREATKMTDEELRAMLQKAENIEKLKGLLQLPSQMSHQFM